MITFLSRKRSLKILSTSLLIGGGYVAYQNYIQHRSKADDWHNDDSNYIYIQQSDDEILQEIDARLSKNIAVYLRLIKTQQNNLMRYALSKLAKLPHLQDHHFSKISNRLGYDASLVLLQQGGADYRFFRAPVNRHLVNTDLYNILENLSRELPHQTALNYYAKTTLSARSRWQKLTIEKKINPDDRQFRQEKCDIQCLEALVNYSYLDEACILMIQNGILAVLRNYLNQYAYDQKVMTLITKLLSQLSRLRLAREHLFITGWFQTLAQWHTSHQLEQRLSAAKILFNLSNDEHVLSSNLYLMSEVFGEPKYADIVFVHGLMGSVFRTWRQADTKKNDDNYTRCWPMDWLSKEMKNVRLLAVDYYTQISDWKVNCFVENSSLKTLGDCLARQLLATGVGERPMVFVTHSMGGLLLKQLLVNMRNSENEMTRKFLANVKGVIFLCVPHRGTSSVDFFIRFERIIQPSSEIRMLTKDSPELLTLNEKFAEIIRENQIDCLSYGERRKSRFGIKNVKWTSHMVPPDSADPGFGAFKLLDTDHFSICKPEDRESYIYSSIKNFANHCLECDQKSSMFKFIFEHLGVCF